jgi:hypothetical protein
VSEDHVIRPEDTTLRWFGPQRPGLHSAEGEVPVPIGQLCAVCKVVFQVWDQGWTMPHRGVIVTVRAYHHHCLFAVLGLNQP